MPAAWWLALAGLPVFQQPLPDPADTPAAIAVASGQAQMRLPCYQLVCGDADWMAPTPYTTLARPKPPGALPSLRPRKIPTLATRSYASLRAPAATRDWVDTEANHVKVATTFGMEAFRNPSTDLSLQFGTGYRLQPYTDYGTDARGPIVGGALQLSHRFGERAWFNQQVQVETGRRNTYTRQTLAVDFLLRPQWTLQSRVEMNHDSATRDTDTRGTVQLQYAF